ncbi:MAG: D-alanine--D-alanine ligase [Anaerolineae bacterium]|nr:D-alanine--D-alanine ligase [Anaerolineae bacterium]
MQNDDRIKVGVIFGGRSGEHAVSLMSARFILASLDPSKYAVTQIGITRQGGWLVGDDVLSALTAERVADLSPATLLPDPSRPELRRLSSIGQSETLEVLTALDVVFPVLHGTFGEDGTLQGLLDMAGLAYVGPGVLGSSVGMDKGVFFDVMRANQIPVVDTVLVLRSQIEADINAAIALAEKAGQYPLFIKPANLGSSVGVSKANNRSDLLEGLLEAAAYDRRVVVQKGLNVREIEVSVLGNDAPEASVCGEVLPGADFYSYDAKYHDDSSQTVIPADIPDHLSEHIRALAVKAFKAIDLAGLARVDFFLDKDSGEIYLNELNTMPGFTHISMYPMLWQASGLSSAALVDRLVQLALARRAEQDATTHEFRRDS